jgi:hypothetical protein
VIAVAQLVPCAARSRLVCRPTAIDQQSNSGNRRGCFARQEDRQRADFLNGGEALIRLLGQQHVADHLIPGDPMRLGLPIDPRFDQRRIDKAGADREVGNRGSM